MPRRGRCTVETDWFLTAAERGNPSTRLDSRHSDGRSYTSGNRVEPLVHGAVYFTELARRVGELRRGDLLLFTDWRGDPDERLSADGDETIGDLFCAAAERGVDVRGLVWRSHWDKLAFSAQENEHLGERIERSGGEVLLDMRVRTGGSHHQKFVVLRHPDRPELDVAFVGGIDLSHSRRDDAHHGGDPQSQPMSAVYGARPPWHDVMVAVRGPAVADVETVFRERWEDRQPLTRNPVHLVGERVKHEDRRGSPLPAQLPDPPPAGDHHVQLLRTYPRRLGGYPFAPEGERSVAHGYTKVLRRARSLVYVEDQYLWSSEVASTFAEALRAQPALHVIAVLPMHPDQDGRVSLPPNLVGRDRAISEIRAAGGDRVAVYGIENHLSVPVYVHAKVCVVDDTWAVVGSDNFNRRSWTHDSELNAAVLDETRDPREPRDPAGLGDGARTYARDLRLQLMREHLDRDSDPTAATGDPADRPAAAGGRPGDPARNGGEYRAGDRDRDRDGDGGDDRDLVDPVGAFEAFRRSAEALEAWHRGDRAGPRPPGRLRPLVDPALSPTTKRWATALYHWVYDPDGRPFALRRRHTF